LFLEIHVIESKDTEVLRRYPTNQTGRDRPSARLQLDETVMRKACPHQYISRMIWTSAVLGVLSLFGNVTVATAAEPVAPTLRATGTGSCAALACHGGRREPLDLKGSEYSFWSTYDPHRKAYGVLFDDRSKIIEKNYRNLATLEESAPERDTTCLSCHVHQNFQKHEIALEESFVSDGVGCEACHGPAEKYLTAHTQTWWKGLSNRDKSEHFGMVDTKDLSGRIEQCATCHVGTPQAEVNHDLIAAGHPRLLFEFANQQSKHPKHWRVEADKARNVDYEVRAWALGQVVATRSSLNLLESRAIKADSKAKDNSAPWPEFAEFDCYSCHHDLKYKGYRQDLYDKDRSIRPGTLAWGDWTLDGVRKIAEVKDASKDDSALARLQKLMASPGPKASEVAKLSREASQELAPLIARVERETFGQREVDGLLSVFIRSSELPKAADWTPAARTYLGFVALAHARADMGGPGLDSEVVDRFEKLRSSLNVPIPVGDERLLDSPANFDPNKVTIELRSIREIFPR
jgi:hypothetical protein